MGVSGLTVRPARADDYDDVVAFTGDTWADREGGDYIPHIYHDWIEGPGGGERRRTLVAEDDEGVVGIAQAVLLSDHEAWCQGMRVAPSHRGEGVATQITRGLFDWARDRGAAVARNMVFSWNVAGLGQSRATGFAPATEFRWARPRPDPDAAPGAAVVEDPDNAWTYWARSDARDHLRGLALSFDETWAMRELTREGLRQAADETAVFAVQDAGTSGMAYRVRDDERENEDGEVEHRVEYGVGAWEDLAACRDLLAAVRRDAGELGADDVRVLIPETVRHVSDVAATRTPVSDEPDFVLAADLTDDRRR